MSLLNGTLSSPCQMPRLPDLPPSDYDQIAAAISSAESPVGIDAKKTHVVILHLLLDLQQRLSQIEARLDTLERRA